MRDTTINYRPEVYKQLQEIQSLALRAYRQDSQKFYLNAIMFRLEKIDKEKAKRLKTVLSQIDKNCTNYIPYRFKKEFGFEIISATHSAPIMFKVIEAVIDDDIAKIDTSDFNEFEKFMLTQFIYSLKMPNRNINLKPDENGLCYYDKNQYPTFQSSLISDLNYLEYATNILIDIMNTPDEEG